MEKAAVQCAAIECIKPAQQRSHGSILHEYLVTDIPQTMSSQFHMLRCLAASAAAAARQPRCSCCYDKITNTGTLDPALGDYTLATKLTYNHTIDWFDGRYEGKMKSNSVMRLATATVETSSDNLKSNSVMRLATATVETSSDYC
jgi:hypothetical protein